MRVFMSLFYPAYAATGRTDWVAILMVQARVGESRTLEAESQMVRLIAGMR
jgi:hypothetical protein